jgi:hypothetical protein
MQGRRAGSAPLGGFVFSRSAASGVKMDDSIIVSVAFAALLFGVVALAIIRAKEEQ